MAILGFMHTECNKQITALNTKVNELNRLVTSYQSSMGTLQKQLTEMTSKYNSLRATYAKYDGKEIIAVSPAHKHTEGIAATRAECETLIKNRLTGIKITWQLSVITDTAYRLYPLALLQQGVASELPRTYATWKATDTATGWHLEYQDCDDDAIHWRYWLQRQFPGCPAMIMFIPGLFFCAALAQGGKILQINGSFTNVQASNIWF